METLSNPDTRIHFGSFELDSRTHELYRDGSRLKIRGHPVDVLAVLLEHPGELVTRETLRKRLWPNDTFVDFEQILNNSIRKLRDALGDDADSPHFIETLPRLGYRFIAHVEKNGTNIYAEQVLPTAQAGPAVPVTEGPSTPHRISRRWVFWSVVAFVVAAFVVSTYWYVHTPLPAPYISHYEQLTLDGRGKVPVGTDGTRVYMNLLEPGGGTLQVPVSGGKVTEFPIGLPAGPVSPAWLANASPDGSKLLLMNQVVAGEGLKVWVVGNLGKPVKYLVTAITTGWSPDGKTVVYANLHGDIFTIGVDGGEPSLLRRDDGPISQIKRPSGLKWSPDGTTLRYTTLGRGGVKMFEMSSTGTNFHEFLPSWNGGALKCCGDWTADGQFYVFLAGPTRLRKGPGVPALAQIWAVDERRGRMRPRIPEPFLLASYPLLWGPGIPSRDGKKLFARGVSLRGELERYDETSKRLEPYLGGISAEMPDFSRDGKYVAYISFPDGILWRANRDGSAPVQLTQPPFYPRNPRWSPDSTQILFADNTQKGVDVLYIVPSQGGTPKRLLPDDGGPQSLGDWSPDGKRVVYTTDPQFSLAPRDAREVEARIVDLATGKVSVLPKGPEGFYAPLWSPDGRYIAGESFDTTKLAIFDLRAGEWKNLLDSENARHHYWTGENIGCHYWSHDSRFIYFLSWIQDKAGVYRVPVSGGRAELVFDIPEGFRGTGYYDYWMSLDPDDTPLILRDVGTDEIYALTLDQK
jgi:Tol biopolymer transport system component/DNA-binding winged helix-turn-helix (wHTH) protein